MIHDIFTTFLYAAIHQAIEEGRAPGWSVRTGPMFSINCPYPWDGSVPVV